jgi:hypothetical protein
VVPSHEKLYVGHGGETNMLYIVRDRVGISERGVALATAARVPSSVATGAYRYDGRVPASLVDAAGRRVAAIKPGHNDLHALAPGVYAVIAPDARYNRRVVKVR